MPANIYNNRMSLEKLNSSEEQQREIKDMADWHEERVAYQKIKQEIGKLNLGIGDKIISTTGTERIIKSFNLRGESSFIVKTKRVGRKETELETLTFESLYKRMKAGTIEKIEHIEEGGKQ